MNKSTKWILILVVSISAFVGVYFLYDHLQEKYAPEQLAEVADEKEEPEVSEEAEVEQQDYTAPDFTVFDADGNSVKLSDYFGKPIVLNFWATWCGYCKKEMPDFNEAYHNNPDVQFLMVNVTDGEQETKEKAQAYIKDEGYDFLVLYDTELHAAKTYGASGLPMTVFIDKDGQLVTYANGMLTAENLAKGLEYIK